jgi:hypothetical protein
MLAIGSLRPDGPGVNLSHRGGFRRLDTSDTLVAGFRSSRDHDQTPPAVQPVSIEQEARPQELTTMSFSGQWSGGRWL